MELDEKWIRAHLPESCADQPIDCFSGEYLDGLTVMQEGERGGPDVAIYRAKDEQDLRWWQLEHICRFINDKDLPPKKTWRWYRDHAENGKWLYVEHLKYDYNAIDDARLYGFESFLQKLKYGFPPDRWEEKVNEHIRLMNRWYKKPHWDYDREALCFIEISDSREHDGDGIEEPRPGSVIKIVDENGRTVSPDAPDKTAASAKGGGGAEHNEEDRIFAAPAAKMGLVVYRDDRYTLGRKDGMPCLIAGGKEYTLSCHPYEPCLYITGEKGAKTAVHNAFDPSVVLELFSGGRTVTSITGLEYDARDFCRMVEYAAQMGDVGIDAAEKVFGDRPKEKKPRTTPPKNEKSHPFEGSGVSGPSRGDSIYPDDPFYELIAQYPACVVDYCIVSSDKPSCRGFEAHRRALRAACEKLFSESSRGGPRRCDVSRARGRLIDTHELFTSNYKEDSLNYRRAFLYPPHENGYSGLDFVKVNNALFPNGTDGLEVFEWTTDWSDYFDEGHEWWGALCLTVCDKSLDRFVVIMASATD